MEGNYRTQTSLFEDRVLGVGQVSILFSYQDGDYVLAHQCTVTFPMRSNWLSGPGRIPLVGCSRNIINL